MANDLDYKVGVDTRQALANLKNLQDRVKTTSSTFDKLKGAIAAIGVGALVRSSLEMANSMRDLASATGFALQSIVGFSQALAENGGRIDRAADGISDFVKNLGEAARGSAELQSSFRKVGVSIEDIRTLSEQDIFRKTLAGLAKIPDTATRTATAFKIMGESVKGVDLVNLNQDLDKFTSESGAFASAINSAGEANQNLKNSFFRLQVTILSAIEPLTSFMALLTQNSGVQQLIESLVRLGTVLAGLFVLSKVVVMLKAAQAGLLGMMYSSQATSAAMISFRQGMADVIRTGRVFRTQLKAIQAQGAVTSATFLALGKRMTFLAGGFIKMLPVIGQLITAFTILNEAIRFITGSSMLEWVDKAIHKMNELAYSMRNLEAPWTEQQAKDFFKGLNWEEGTFKLPGKTETDDNNGRAVIDALESRLEAINKIGYAYKSQTSDMLEQLKIQREQVSMTEMQVEVQNNVLALQQNTRDAINQLREQYKELLKDPVENAKLLEIVNQKIQEISMEYERQRPLVEAITAELYKERKQMEAIKQAAEDKAEAMKLATDYVNGLTDSLEDTRREFAQLNMNSLERQIDDISRAVDKDLKTKIQELQKLQTPQNKADIEKMIAEITQASKSFKDAQIRIAKESDEQQRSFVHGWRSAFQDYVDEATNASAQAESAFKTATQGMEDAIVNFAKTGKFEWKSFLSSLVDDLLRSQARQLVGNIFAGLGGSNRFSGFFADGGLIPAGSFGIVGEHGPEMISGPAQITPMTGSGSVTYNINAVDAMSFKQMIARDPQFLYAITEEGRRGLPGRR